MPDGVVKVGDHPAIARRADGSLVSHTWQESCRSGFLAKCFKESDKVLLASRGVHVQVVAIFGGETAWWKFVNDNNLSFFSDSTDENTIVTTCHPEGLHNPRYLNWKTLYFSGVHDRLYTAFGRFMGNGDDYVCTFGHDIMEKNGGSEACKLLLRIEMERRARSSEQQSKLYRDGDHNFLNYATDELEKEGIFVGPGEDPNSVLQTFLIQEGRHPFQQYATQELKRRGIGILPGTNVLSLYHSLHQQELMIDGDHNFQLYATQQLERRGIAILPGTNVLSLYQQVLMIDGDHNFQLYATQQLKKRGREVSEGESAISIYKSEQAKENKNPLQIHATEALKKRGIVVKEGESAISIYKSEQAKENKNPLQNLTAAQIKKRVDNTSKSKTKEESKTQVKWNKNLKAFIDFDGVPKRSDKEGVWLMNQRSNLRNMAKKDKVFADNLAKLEAACKAKSIIF